MVGAHHLAIHQNYTLMWYIMAVYVLMNAVMFSCSVWRLCEVLMNSSACSRQQSHLCQSGESGRKLHQQPVVMIRLRLSSFTQLCVSQASRPNSFPLWYKVWSPWIQLWLPGGSLDDVGYVYNQSIYQKKKRGAACDVARVTTGLVSTKDIH